MSSTASGASGLATDSPRVTYGVILVVNAANPG